MKQFTDEEINELVVSYNASIPYANLHNEQHVECHSEEQLMDAYEAGFKKAQELLSVQGTKPLSEITELELSELAEISNITIGNHFSDDFESIQSFKKHITDIKSFRGQRSSMPHDICWPVDFFDYLRSKGYILPTQKA